MEISNDMTNEARVFRASEHQIIADQFCGQLTILPNASVLAKGFTNNIGHSHSQFEETYLVLEGNLVMELYNPATGAITEVALNKLDALKIPRGIGHKVIGGSNDNSIMVSCDPHFVPGDETLCTELEQRYVLLQGSMPSVSSIASRALHQVVYAKGVLDDFVKYFRQLEMGSSFFNSELSEYTSIYKFHAFSQSGYELSRRLSRAAEAILDERDGSAQIVKDCRDYFFQFFRALELGELIIEQKQPDGLFSKNGKRHLKSKIIEELRDELMATFERRIRQI